MTSVSQKILSIRNSIPEHVSLVAVSKTKPNEDIIDAYNIGHKAFGENKVQELVRKSEELPRDIEWHMIGHLQTNKVKYIAPFIGLVHSVDSFKLLKTINKEANKNNRVINCLLQCKVAEEETKFGLSESELSDMIKSTEYSELENVSIRGVMGMATFTEDKEKVRHEFSTIKNIFDHLKSEFFIDKPEFVVISMGMSHDYNIAIEEGATMIRVGSNIFGERNYSKV